MNIKIKPGANITHEWSKIYNEGDPSSVHLHLQTGVVVPEALRRRDRRPIVQFNETAVLVHDSSCVCDEMEVCVAKLPNDVFHHQTVDPANVLLPTADPTWHMNTTLVSRLAPKQTEI